MDMWPGATMGKACDGRTDHLQTSKIGTFVHVKVDDDDRDEAKTLKPREAIIITPSTNQSRPSSEFQIDALSTEYLPG